MSKDSKSSNSDKQQEEMAMVAIVGFLVLLIAPIFVVALPIALLLGAFLDEDNGYLKFAFGAFFACTFYFFLFGTSGGFHQGLMFSALNDFSRGLFNDVMSMKPGFIKFYPQYPGSVRNYFYYSLPVSLVLAVYFSFKSKKKVDKGHFAKKPMGAFSAFLQGLSFFGYPFDLCFKVGLRAGGELFTSKVRVLIFSFCLLFLGYIVAYLFFGPVNSWHIHFGYFVNKMSPGFFNVLSPEGLNAFKYIFYYGGFLYLAY